MATNSMVPYSNPQGNNQTNPGTGGVKNTLAPSLPGATSTLASATGASTANPLVPATATTGAAATVPSASVGDSGSELNSIFGSGVGGDINSFLGSVSGTNSVVLQDYVKSLQPQMATAQAQTNAALGAGGVSANSSVAGIADANLNAQETASIAGESANLTESGLANAREHDSRYGSSGGELHSRTIYDAVGNRWSRYWSTWYCCRRIYQSWRNLRRIRWEIHSTGLCRRLIKHLQYLLL